MTKEKLQWLEEVGWAARSYNHYASAVETARQQLNAAEENERTARENLDRAMAKDPDKGEK